MRDFKLNYDGDYTLEVSEAWHDTISMQIKYRGQIIREQCIEFWDKKTREDAINMMLRIISTKNLSNLQSAFVYFNVPHLA